jgi:hypothetical protein
MQTINVAKEAGYAEVKAKMAAELMEKLKAVGDPRVTADPVPFENPPFISDTKTGQQGKGKKGKGKAKAEWPDLHSASSLLFPELPQLPKLLLVRLRHCFVTARHDQRTLTSQFRRLLVVLGWREVFAELRHAGGTKTLR